ncbi:MAG: flagellin [Nitrososphaeria archaeon]|nr:flagellin [Nitrosopumilaceae archaeon]NDB90554.1 flagellin [Nitrososphaerota archaeon]NDF29744.1 flagellin [Nitrososphaeria archaeon]NDF47241.1 flagellin [Nitrosopumilaceae archaeon]
MASVVVSETILIIASVIVAGALSATVLGQMSVFDSAFSAATESQKDIVLTKIKIIYATNTTDTKVSTWIKNVGMSSIKEPNLVDVYFGKLGSVQRIPYNNGTVPTWNYSAPVNVWQIKETAQINIYYDTNLVKGSTYVIKATTPNGITDDHVFSVS